MENIFNIFIPKWAGILLLQIGLGLLCIFSPWYLVIPFSISFALVILLCIRFRWWAYIFVFFIPLIGMKNPGFVVEAASTRNVVFSRETLPLIILLSVFPFFAFILQKSAKLHKDTMRSPFFIPILLFVYYSFITFFWSPANINLDLFYFIYLILDISLFYFLFHVIDNEGFHKRLMWCLIFLGIFLSIQTFLSFSTVITDIKGIKFKIFDWLLFVVYHKLVKGQHSGWFAGQGVTAATLNIIIFVAMGLFLTEKSKARIWFLRAVIAMLFVAVFSVGNRGGIYSLVTTIFFFLFISTKLRKNFLKNSLIVISMILLIFLSTKYVGKHQTPRAVQVSTAKGSSLALRLEYWKEGFEQVSKRSLTLSGLGIGGYTAVNRMAVLHPHNLYFHLLFDFGFIGIIFICAVILILARIFLKIVNYQETYLQNMSIAFASAFICIGITGVVSFTYYLSMLWLLLALGSSTFYMTQKELFEEKQITNAALHGMACGHSEVIGAPGSKVVSQQL